MSANDACIQEIIKKTERKLVEKIDYLESVGKYKKAAELRKALQVMTYE